MLNKEPGPEREQLRFKDAVLADFKFLSDFGLRAVEEKATFVRYESPRVFVNVYHGRASYELGIEIGRAKEPEKPLHIFTVVRWAGAEKAEGFGQHVMFQVSSREGVQEFVPRLAALVKKYAAALLRGDESAFRSAREFQAKQAAAYEKEVRLSNLRTRGGSAWHAKDYAQVVELYSPVREDLTEVEAKKLAYAEQRVLAHEGAAGSRAHLRKKR